MDDSNDVLPSIVAVVADTFAVDPSELGPDTIADDVDGWDSVSHAMLMLALEERFGITLAFEETIGLADLAALAAHIAALRQ